MMNITFFLLIAGMLDYHMAGSLLLEYFTRFLYMQYTMRVAIHIMYSTITISSTEQLEPS